MAVVRPQRGEVYLIALDPTRGREIRKTRPCVVISPDELNEHLQTLLVAPLTTGGHPYPFRISCRFQRKKGYVVLDQVRAIDVGRLVRRLGRLSPATLTVVLRRLQEMFAE
jgi:mRNA interferase MazF